MEMFLLAWKAWSLCEFDNAEIESWNKNIGQYMKYANVLTFEGATPQKKKWIKGRGKDETIHTQNIWRRLPRLCHADCSTREGNFVAFLPGQWSDFLWPHAMAGGRRSRHVGGLQEQPACHAGSCVAHNPPWRLLPPSAGSAAWLSKGT